MQELSVPAPFFIPDYQVYHKTFLMPVAVCLYKLSDKINICRIFYLQQHDRQVS